MIRTWFKSTFRLTLFLFTLIVIVVLFLDKTNYTQQEIEWCATERPLLPIELCAREFGY